MSVKSVEILIRGDAKQAISEIGKLSGAVAAESESMGSKFAAFGKKAALVMGGVGVAVAGFSIKAALDFETSIVRLQTAIKNTGGALQPWKSQIADTNTQLEKFGFTNADVENSLARLVPVTKSSTQATGLMTLAADIARARHLSLEAATQLLVKVQTGHVALLGRLGIATKDLTGHTISQQDAITMLAKMYGGSAARNSETFGGKIDTLKAQLTDLGVKIGQALIPIIEQMVGAIQVAIGWFEKHKTVAEALSITVGVVLVAAMATWVASVVAGAVASVAAMATAAAGFVINAAIMVAAMLPVSLPILAIIAILAAIGVAAYLLATNWSTAWATIKGVADAIIKPIADIVLMPIRLTLDAINVAIDVLSGNWSAAWARIQQTVQDAVSPITDAISAIKGAVDSVSSLFGGGPSLQSTVQSGLANVAQTTAHQHGVQRRAGGGSFGPGWLLTGEHGPELMHVGSGGSVVPNSALGGPQSVEIPVYLDGRVLTRVVVNNINGDRGGPKISARAVGG